MIKGFRVWVGSDVEDGRGKKINNTSSNGIGEEVEGYLEVANLHTQWYHASPVA